MSVKKIVSIDQSPLYVRKRDGRQENVMFDKITSRIQNLCYSLDMNHIHPNLITLKVINGIYSSVSTKELDNLAAETAASMTTKHPDYAILAARIAVSNLHKETTKCFSELVEKLYKYVNPKTGLSSPMIAEDVYHIIMKNKDKLNSAIIYNNDYNYTYFGFKTLERSYLLKINGVVVERPQHMLMRVSVGIHKEDIDSALITYKYLSERLFTHASPTLFNGGTPRPQLSSCFLIAMKDDSIEGIFDTLKTCAIISKYAGGVGLHVHNIRASGSYIAGTNGESNGLVPMLRVFNNCSCYVDQGGNKRPGSFAIYLEPWHADILQFLDLKKNTGSEEVRARDLFYALWICDLFMECVEKDEDWYLMCPHECPGLSDCWGEDFNKLYKSYIADNKYRKAIKARKVWFAVLESQIETGTPYIMYKDSCNRKSNQQNLGTIKSSNLCTEIVQYTSPEEVAVCNLGSIPVNMYVEELSEDGTWVSIDCGTIKNSTRRFNFDKLRQVTKLLTKNLDKVIDVNFYPVVEAERSNKLHRPIGIGIQGLADCFILMRMAFESPEAALLNRQIFETIYYGALESSCELAKKDGTYSTYKGSPVSKGMLQFDMWDVKPTDLWNWTDLRKNIAEHGIKNSLLVSPMPTASTAQILGNNESIEPYTSNIYSRRVLSGEFQIVNKHLLKDLIDLNIWNDEIKNQLIAENGSVQNIHSIPDSLKILYKTAWEISQKTLINLAADRAAFIDQSQSFNIFMANADSQKLSSMHFYGWKKGLKTGIYYLRTRPAADPIQFTVDKESLKVEQDKQAQAKLMCSIANRENCEMCSG